MYITTHRASFKIHSKFTVNFFMLRNIFRRSIIAVHIARSVYGDRT